VLLMRAFLLLVCVVAVLVAARKSPVSTEVRFQAWMAKYSKNYAQAEYKTRLNNYIANTKKVAQLNAESQALNSTAVFELNMFADLSEVELSTRLGLRDGYQPGSVDAEVVPTSPQAPTSFDWRKQNKLTPIKDQGQCGSCWAFSCTESIESVYMITKGVNGPQMPPLAPQQIVDCDTGDGGCNGGDLPTCYAYVKRAGLEKNSDYPYHARDGTCQAVASKDFVHITGFKYVIPRGSKSETDMASYLAASSPMSIIVDASRWSFYKGGVLTAAQCGHSLDHAVQAIGYDTTAKYWIVRNSWGASWGESGYIRLQFGANTCGLCSEVTVPTL